MIPKHEPKTKEWSCLCHDMVYDGIEELWGHCTSLKHSSCDLEEWAATAVDLNKAVCTVMYNLEESAVFLREASRF